MGYGGLGLTWERLRGLLKAYRKRYLIELSDRAMTMAMGYHEPDKLKTVLQDTNVDERRAEDLGFETENWDWDEEDDN